jgi:hypothetical protein
MVLEVNTPILKKYGKVEKLPIDYKIYNKLKGIAAYKRKGKCESEGILVDFIQVVQ